MESIVKQKRQKSRQTGSFYEGIAADYLEKKNYEILQKNFYSRHGEIDLVAKDGKYLVFVEVKYRTSCQSGHPLETVNLKKQQRIKKAAQFYLQRYRVFPDTPCRFDVVAILGEEIMHIQDAFQMN